MSTAENPVLTTHTFIESWKVQDENRLTAELVSLNKETNRQTDNYNFNIQNGLLTDPETNRPILEFIAPGVEKDIAINLQNWATQNDEGLAYWISPSQENKYPCEKIIIHKIAYEMDGQKVLMNSAILFDAKLENPEELRKTLFTTQDNEENLAKILSWVENISKQKINENKYINIREQASYYAELIKMGVDPFFIIEDMQKSGFLGKNPVSCPGGQSFSNLVDSYSSVSIMSVHEDKYGSLTFVCPSCSALNTREYGRLISSCQSCGADVTC